MGRAETKERKRRLRELWAQGQRSLPKIARTLASTLATITKDVLEIQEEEMDAAGRLSNPQAYYFDAISQLQEDSFIARQHALGLVGLSRVEVDGKKTIDVATAREATKALDLNLKYSTQLHELQGLTTKRHEVTVIPAAPLEPGLVKLPNVGKAYNREDAGILAAQIRGAIDAIEAEKKTNGNPED